MIAFLLTQIAKIKAALATQSNQLAKLPSDFIKAPISGTADSDGLLNIKSALDITDEIFPIWFVGTCGTNGCALLINGSASLNAPFLKCINYGTGEKIAGATVNGNIWYFK